MSELPSRIAADEDVFPIQLDQSGIEEMGKHTRFVEEHDLEINQSLQSKQ
jgi:hypothetical protein